MGGQRRVLVRLSETGQGMSQPFRPDPARDASPAIGGFVYQLDWSVLRWLQLGPGEALELEGGEDIDILARGTLGDDDEHRTLVALKRVRRPVSLRTPSAVAAVAHLAGHRHRNPSRRLSMIYLTTAAPTRERGVQFPNGALCRWNAARRAGRLSPRDRDGLLTLLRGARRPPRGVTDEDWDALHRTLAEPDGLASLVDGLEWVVEAPSGIEVRRQCVALLVGAETIASEDAAEAAHDCLFVEMLRGIIAGRKRFDRPDLERSLAAISPGAHTEEAASRRAKAVELDRVSQRVDALEALTHSVLHELGVVGPALDAAELGRIAPGHVLNALVGYLGPPVDQTAEPNVAPPPSGPSSVPRDDAVAALSRQASRHTWVHVHGTIRTGKTTLVRQLISPGGRTIWLRCRDLREPAVLSLLRSIVCRGSRDPALALARRVGSDGVLVLDDLPAIGHPELTATLAVLSELLGHTGGIITTGPRRLDEGPGAQVAAPPFTVSELRQLLALHDAPEPVLANPATLRQVLYVTKGHPERLRHAVEVLKRSDWLVPKALPTLFAPQGEEAEVSRLLRAVDSTVPDGNRRQLLFRLSVFDGSFGAADADKVAEIPVAVPDARTHVACLEGLWLERDGEKLWTVSPAVQPFGPQQLHPTARASVHLYAAERHLAAGRLTPVDTLRTVEHLERAGQAERAGRLAAGALLDMLSNDRIDHDPGIAYLWPNLPAAMPSGARLWLRAAQLRAHHSAGRARELAQWIRLLGAERNAESSDPDALLTSLVVHAAVVTIDPVLAARWVIDAAAAAPPETLTDSFIEELLEHTASLHGWHVKRPQHLSTWVELLARVPPSRRRELTTTPGFALVASEAMPAMWMDLRNAGTDEGGWQAFLAQLSDLRERSAALGLDLMVAASIRASIIVLCEEFNALDDAVALADAHARTLVPGGCALLLDEAGRQLVYRHRDEEGLRYLEVALAAYPDGPEYGVERFNAHLIACEGAGRLDQHARAATFARAAVEVATEPDTLVPAAERLVAHAEHAVALWRGGRRREAFRPLEKAMEVLLQSDDRDDLWEARFVLIGHTTGYCSSFAASGRPPPYTRSGEPYVPPEPGMYRHRRRDLAKHFRAEDAGVLPAHLLTFAIAIRDWNRAMVWARRTIQMTRVGAPIDAAAAAHQLMGVDALRSGDLDGGLEALLHELRALVWTADLVDTATTDPTDARAVLRAMPAPKRASFVGVMAENAAFAVLAVLGADPTKRRKAWCARTAAWLDELYELAADPCIADAAVIVRSMAVSSPGTSMRSIAARDPRTSEPGPWGLAHLGLALFGGPPRTVFVHHLNAVRVIEQRRRNIRSIYDLLLVPHLVELWRRTVDDAGALFRAPAQLRRDLSAIAARADANVLRHTLLAVGDSLAVQLPREIRAELGAEQGDPIDT